MNRQEQRFREKWADEVYSSIAGLVLRNRNVALLAGAYMGFGLGLALNSILPKAVWVPALGFLIILGGFFGVPKVELDQRQTEGQGVSDA